VNQGVTAESTLLKASIERLPDWAAEALELCPDAHGVTLERLRIEAVSAPRSLAGLLEVPYRCPLVYIKSVARNASGTPIDCYHAWVRTDRLRIVVETDAWASLAGRVVSQSAVGAPNGGPERLP